MTNRIVTCGAALALVLCAMLSPVFAAEGDPASGPDEMPDGILLFVQSSPLEVLSQNLLLMLRRINDGETTGPGNHSVKMPTLEGLHARRGGVGEDSHRLVQLLAALCKVPAHRMEYFINKRGAVYYLLAASGESGAPLQQVWSFPVRNMRELVAFWRSDKVLQHIIRSIDDGDGRVFEITFPQYGTYYICDAGVGRVAAAGDPSLALRVADQLAEWTPPAITDGGDLQVVARIDALRQRRAMDWLATFAPSLGDLPDVMFPRHTKALLRFPNSLIRFAGESVQQVERIEASFYLHHGGLSLTAEVTPTPDSALTRQVGRYEAPHTPLNLLPTLPGTSACFATIPDGAGVLPTLEPMIASCVLDEQVGDVPPGPDALRVLLTEAGAHCAGEVVLGVAMGELYDLNVLLGFRARSASAANEYAQAVASAYPRACGVSVIGDAVLLGIGFTHARILERWAEAVREEDRRLSESGYGWEVVSSPALGRYRKLAIGGVYPVAFAKAMMGNIMLQFQLNGVPIESQRMLEAFFKQAPNSPNPLVLGVGGDGQRLQIHLAAPLGCVMDVARLTNDFTGAFDGMNRDYAERMLRAQLLEWQRQLLPPELLQTPAVSTPADSGAP